jgi:nucleotide-binding universal stress UspA family protein
VNLGNVADGRSSPCEEVNALKVCIKGAAEDVKFGDIDEVCFDIDMILLPVDGSEPAVIATQYAVMLAKTFDSKVKAIYVDTGIEQLELPDEIEAEDVYEGVHPSVKGLAIAKTMCERNGVDCDAEVVRGGVAKRIIATASDSGCDLIVMGDTGRTGLKRIALGSIAETVAKAADVPVMVVKAD